LPNENHEFSAAAQSTGQAGMLHYRPGQWAAH